MAGRCSLIFSLLGLPGVLPTLNYTEVQRLTLLRLPADIRQNKARTFGSEEMIAADIRQMLGRTRTDRSSRWIYPSSSTHEMMELYRAEVSLTSSLQDLRRQLEAAQLQPGLTEHRHTASLLAASDLPPDRDFYEAGGLGIVQVSGLYQLNLSRVTAGEVAVLPNLPSPPSPHRLSAEDCGQLAVTARDLGRLDLQLDWLREAVRLAKQGGGGSLARLRARLKESRKFHDELLLEHGYFIPREKYEAELGRVEAGMPVVTKMLPDQRRLRNDTRLGSHLERMRLRDSPAQHLHTNSPELYFTDSQINTVMFNLLHRESDNMTRLCSGEATRQPHLDRDLRCRLITKSDPYLRLGPFLLEELNIRPYIGLVHRFLGVEEAGRVMERAVEGEGLIPTPYTVRGVWRDFSRGRASKIRYLPDRAGDITAELTRRMARLSSWKLLEPFAQENYQVMNYGPGGLISVHVDDRTLGYQPGDFDPAQSLLDWSLGTIRLATAMLYLKSAQAGGRTVFPLLSLSVPASPLALLFWHNLTPDLQADTRAVHAACPVVMGDKWILNKWVRLPPHWQSHGCRVSRDKQAAFPAWR